MLPFPLCVINNNILSNKICIVLLELCLDEGFDSVHEGTSSTSVTSV